MELFAFKEDEPQPHPFLPFSRPQFLLSPRLLFAYKHPAQQRYWGRVLVCKLQVAHTTLRTRIYYWLSQRLLQQTPLLRFLLQRSRFHWTATSSFRHASHLHDVQRQNATEYHLLGVKEQEEITLILCSGDFQRSLATHCWK